MHIDLKLPSNEILLFENDTVTMTERNAVFGFGGSGAGGGMGGIAGLQGEHKSFRVPFTKKSERYDLVDIMKNGESVLNSPAFHGNRLNPEGLKTLGGKQGNNILDDTKSFRSKRSISINVNKVSKITKVNGESTTALSKEKGGVSALRHNSVDRAASRGRGASGS